MPTPNLYWPVYKNLEKEFLSIADFIHFSDDQANVYSMHIADLILRCAVEIEALSKELYCQLGGNMDPTNEDGIPRDLYFDTDCLKLLEEKWRISKKEITDTSLSFYFEKPEYRIMTPLHKSYKRGTSGSKWKQAYQALKHDRKNSLKRATVINLLHAMGALYILNLYYRDERVDVGRVYLSEKDFDCRAGSEIFSASCYRATLLAMSDFAGDNCLNPPPGDALDPVIFVIKYNDDSFKEIHRSYCLDAEETQRNFNSNLTIYFYLQEHPEYKTDDKPIGQICLDIGGIHLYQQVMCHKHRKKLTNVRMEAVLNKHAGIYPNLSPQESLA